ncbi:MAG: sn-glycerol-3-phosphate ABC transporter ATP-binding protein UgpC [Deltaproteobacteria bacterium]|nr:sn-glycerol-3-phosphate ABC transporter ATP-binding protein UgpC [Deltaproteobacteria bacterium]
MAAITLKPIQKSYGDTHVVKGLDLDIKDGEFVVLVGPSGCGKSTTLRMIAGLESISGGELLIDNQKVNDVAAGERDLAMVFQSYALYPHMTVRENIGFGLKVRKTPKPELDEKVLEVTKMLGLEDYLERKPAHLSGGQRQRVAMARAIVRRPKAFLFDEPLSNLDAKLRTEVRAKIARLRRQLGTTTVYVTHDQVEAMTLADRVVILNEGKAQQIGSPMEVYQKTANLFVASFLGTPIMNIAAGKTENHKFSTQEGALDEVDFAPEGAAHIGLRPHDLWAAQKTPQKAGHDFIPLGSLQVDVVERLGPETFVFGDASGLSLAARADVDTEMEAGEEIGLFVDKKHLHFFGEDGQRLEA